LFFISVLFSVVQLLWVTTDNRILKKRKLKNLNQLYWKYLQYLYKNCKIFIMPFVKCKIVKKSSKVTLGFGKK